MPESFPAASLFSRAESWAASLWDVARDRWSDREGQDRNYRIHVVHPPVRSILRESFPENGIRLLDLGCGDGSFLDDPENRALLQNGAYLGVDISPELIRQASERYSGSVYSFQKGDLSDPETAKQLLNGKRSWNSLLSVFVIQEVPDVGAFLANIARITVPGSLAIVVTVHPEFALRLRETGAMNVECCFDEYKDNPNWQWAGQYPIVDDFKMPFYLPYFHRSIDEYQMLFRRAGFSIREMRGIPDAEGLADLYKKRISPFIPFDTNCYWPRIGEGPSALIITAEREADHG